ncbi:MAG TPA: hypothetical protein VKN18_04805 [Blastocatellia bacterium]|nr:hypothetical protein [Blastocatellia bacterium]
MTFEERATCPRWDKAISEWFPNEDTAKCVQRLVGQAALGIVRDHIFVIHSGGGLNGKGTFTRALACVLGDYATTVDLALLTETRHGAHDASTSVLFRRRLAFASETSRRVRLAEAQVKNLTGGDAIQARRLYENPWQFEPTPLEQITEVLQHIEPSYRLFFVVMCVTGVRIGEACPWRQQGLLLVY